MRLVGHSTQRLRNVFVASIGARIRTHYEGLPESNQATPCVDPELALLPKAFHSDAMKSLYHFTISVRVGSRLSHADQVKMEAMLHTVESVASRVQGGAMTESCSTPESLAAGLRAEQDRVLAARGWMQVPITTSGRTYNFYHRDLLDVGIEDLCGTNQLELDGGPLRPSADGHTRRSHTLNTDLFVQEYKTVQLTHGKDARVLLATRHADEAVVSWIGAHYMFPIRAEFPSVDSGGHRMKIGYVPHIAEALEQTARALQVVSDTRTDLFQRCLAVVFRRFIRASEVRYPVIIPGLGLRQLVLRVGGLVVDLMEEKIFLALMGHISNMLFARTAACVVWTPVVRKLIWPSCRTLSAHWRRSILRRRLRGMPDPRASLRTPLAAAQSALRFIPVLGAMHGLRTGNKSHFRIIS